MRTLKLRLFLKYAEASGRLQDPFEEVWEDYKWWKFYTIDIEPTYWESENEALNCAINAMSAIIDNGFCGEWKMFYYDNPWAVIEEYDL